jgi:hypothetical protein
MGGFGGPQQGFGGPPQGFGGPPPGGSSDVASSASTWFVLSILCTLLCCLPLGIVGIIFTNDAKNLAARGDYATAEQKLGTGKMVTIIGIALAAVIWVIYVILMVFGAMASFRF